MKRAASSRARPASDSTAVALRPASQLLQIQNRQRTQRVDSRLLKKLLSDVLSNDLGVAHYEICVHLVGAREMTSVNETFLQHGGSTDVITFSHREPPSATELHGELFVCVDEAIELAPRFRGTWQSELVRYAVHGFLHLQGHDDREPLARRRMKRVENQVLRSLRKRLAVERIGSGKRRAK